MIDILYGILLGTVGLNLVGDVYYIYLWEPKNILALHCIMLLIQIISLLFLYYLERNFKPSNRCDTKLSTLINIHVLILVISFCVAYPIVIFWK